MGSCSNPHLRCRPAPKAVLDLGSLSIRLVGGRGRSSGKRGHWELLPNSAPKRMHQHPVPTHLKRVTKANSLVEVEKPFGITFQNLICHLTQPFYPEFSIPIFPLACKDLCTGIFFMTFSVIVKRETTYLPTNRGRIQHMTYMLTVGHWEALRTRGPEKVEGKKHISEQYL